MSLFRFCNLFFLFFAFHFEGMAQYDGNSCLRFKDLKVESATWNEGQTLITTFSKGDIDSVVFIENGQNRGSFRVKNEQIISPCIVITDLQGRTVSIDSVRTPSWASGHYLYFGYSTITAVKWEYGPNGIPSKMFRKDVRGKDSLIREWDANGILRSESLKGTYPETFRYSANGVLKSAEKDTLINYRSVKRVRNYSVNGIIQKESWFWDDLPCETWSIYDSKGKLAKTIKHISLPADQPLPPTVEMAEEQVFAIVNENAEPAGGQTQFFRYLETKLSRDLCKRYISADTYLLRFEVQENGDCVYKSVQGSDSSEVESFFKAAIENSPYWQIAKRQGRPCKETFSLLIQVK